MDDVPEEMPSLEELMQATRLGKSLSQVVAGGTQRTEGPEPARGVSPCSSPSRPGEIAPIP